MKITNVEALYLRLPEIKARTDSSQDALLIRITTDAGIIGWGEVDGCPWVIKAIVEAPMSHTLVTGLRQILIGEDPMEIERPLAQDVPGDALLRPRGCGDPGHGRDRPGAVGHQGQGAARCRSGR